MAEFGLVFPQRPAALRLALPDAIEDAGNDLGGIARLALQRAQQQWDELDEHLSWCDQRIAAHLKDSPDAASAQQLIGVGPVGASAVVATVGDFKQFKNGSQFGAWLGLTPRQHSSGGKNNLGGITRQERAHPVGGADQRPAVRCATREREPGRGSAAANWRRLPELKISCQT